MHEDEDMSFEDPQMSEWSGRHCLREYTGGQLKAGLAADVDRHRMCGRVVREALQQEEVV